MSPWKDYYKCGLFVASCRALYHGERKIVKKKKGKCLYSIMHILRNHYSIYLFLKKRKKKPKTTIATSSRTTNP